MTLGSVAFAESAPDVYASGFDVSLTLRLHEKPQRQFRPRICRRAAGVGRPRTRRDAQSGVPLLKERMEAGRADIEQRFVARNDGITAVTALSRLMDDVVARCST